MFLRSIKLRKADGCQKLVGPTISQAKTNSFYIDSTKVAVNVPRHRTKSAAESRTANKKIQLQYNLFDNLIRNRPGWIAYAPLLRLWDFYGPIFSGELGHVALNAAVMRPSEINNDVSYFHPRAFEYIVGDYLKYRFADSKSIGKPNWKAPCNWQTKIQLPTIAAKFDVNRSNGYLGKRYRYLVAPISNHLLFSIEARISASSCTTSDDGEFATHDMSNMDQLVDDIFASVNITLSPESAEQQRVALAGLEDASLVEDYPPLKWGGRRVAGTGLTL